MKWKIGTEIVETLNPLLGYETTVDLGIRLEKNTNQSVLSYSWQPHKDRYQTTFKLNIPRTESQDLYSLFTTYHR